MWTYLAIFLSLTVLLLVFVRRLYLFFKKDTETQADSPAEKNVSDNDAASSKKISRDDANTVEELCKKGDSYIKSGKDEDAVKCFVQALAIDALHFETQHKLAMLYLQKQMWGAAAAMFKQLGEATNDAVHYSHMGLALYQQCQYEDAKKAYQKAVELDSSRPQRFVSLAQVYRALKQFNHAIVALKKALEMDEQNLDFLFLLADLQAELGNFDEAKEILRRIFEIDSKHPEAKALLKEIKKLIKEAPSA